MRPADTYRSERRNAWRDEYQVANRDWRSWNVDYFGSAGFSIPSRIYPTTIYRRRDRSRYMPHNGTREMERRRSKMAAA